MNAVIKKFPHRTPARIVGEPTYQFINGLLKKLYANAASITSALGGVKHGNVGILMTATLYATLSNVEYKVPPNPGPSPEYPARVTTAEKYALNTQHAKELAEFETHTEVSDAIKQKIIEAVEDPYLHALEDSITGLMGVSPKQIIQHLLKRYGRITPAEIKRNFMAINDAIDPDQHIDIYFKKIEDCIQYADAGKATFSPEQIVLIVYNSLHASGVFDDACKEWRKKSKNDQNWSNLKDFFAKEYQDIQETQRVTSSTHGYSTANVSTYHTFGVNTNDNEDSTPTAFTQFALATIAEQKATLNQVLKANEKLTELNLELTEQLKFALASISTHAGTPSNNNVGKKKRKDSNMDPNG